MGLQRSSSAKPSFICIATIGIQSLVLLGVPMLCDVVHSLPHLARLKLIGWL
jgi:hypothetical protein